MTVYDKSIKGATRGLSHRSCDQMCSSATNSTGQDCRLSKPRPLYPPQVLPQTADGNRMCCWPHRRTPQIVAYPLILVIQPDKLVASAIPRLDRPFVLITCRDRETGQVTNAKCKSVLNVHLPQRVQKLAWGDPSKRKRERGCHCWVR